MKLLSVMKYKTGKADSNDLSFWYAFIADLPLTFSTLTYREDVTTSPDGYVSTLLYTSGQTLPTEQQKGAGSR